MAANLNPTYTLVEVEHTCCGDTYRIRTTEGSRWFYVELFEAGEWVEFSERFTSEVEARSYIANQHKLSCV